MSSLTGVTSACVHQDTRCCLATSQCCSVDDERSACWYLFSVWACLLVTAIVWWCLTNIEITTVWWEYLCFYQTFHWETFFAMLLSQGINVFLGTEILWCTLFCTCAIFPACDICCFEDKLTFLGTKYDNSVIDHPALIDVHCIISIKCAKYLPWNWQRKCTFVMFSHLQLLQSGS